MDNQNDQLCLSNDWCSPIHRKQRRLGTMDMIVWLQVQQPEERGMLAHGIAGQEWMSQTQPVAMTGPRL